MNANFNTDVKNIVDEKIAEIFKNYLAGYQEEESKEEQNILKELKAMNKKIDNLTKVIDEIKTKPLPATNSSPIEDAQSRANTINKSKAKKEEVFIPQLDDSEVTINYRDKNKINENQTDLSNSNFMNSLDALKKLK